MIVFIHAEQHALVRPWSEVVSCDSPVRNLRATTGQLSFAFNQRLFLNFHSLFSLNEVHWFRSCIQQQSLPRPLEPGGKGPLKEYSRAMLHSIVTKEPVAAQLITWHNLWFMLNLLTESWMHHLDACSQRSQGPQFLIFVIQSFILSFCLTIVVCAVPQDLRSVRLRAWFIKKTQKSESHPNTECQEMREAIKANTFHEPWYVLSPASFFAFVFLH